MATIHARSAPYAGMARTIEASCGALAGFIGLLFVLREHGAVASVGGCHAGDPGQTVICVAGIAPAASTTPDPFRSLPMSAVAIGVFLAIGICAFWHSRTTAIAAQTMLCVATGAAGLLGAYAIPAYGFGYLPGVALAVGACPASGVVQRSSATSRAARRDGGVN